MAELTKAAHLNFHSEFKDYSIGHGQIRTLIYVSRHEGVSQLELAKCMNLDKSSITSQLKILEKNGYIKRKPCIKDARVHEISITEKTRLILKPLETIFAAWNEILFEGFTYSERQDVFNYLERMHENAMNKLDQIKEKNK